MGVKDISKTMTLKDGVSGTLRKINAGTVQYKRNLQELKSVANSAWSSIKTGALAASAAISAGVTAVATIGIRANASAEMAEKSFGILLQSADGAKKMVSDLQKLAVASPFEFSGLQDAAKTLMGMGFTGKQVIPMLYSLGDAVAAVGGDTEQMKGIALALGQIQSKGKLSAEEMNQLAERGVPAWSILSKQMGKSTAELMKMGQKGELFSSKVIPLLVKGLGEKYGGSMEKMSDTFNYTLANMKEAATLKLAGWSKPLFEEIKKDMNSLQGALSGGGLEEWGSRFSSALLGIYHGAKAAAKMILTVSSFVIDNWGIIGPIVYGVAAGFAAYGLAILAVKTYTVAMTAATFVMTVAQMGLNAAMRANPYGWIAMLIGVLITAGVYLVKNWETVKLAGMKTWNVIVESVQWAVNMFIKFSNFLIKVFVFAWDSVEYGGKKIWNGILSVAESGINGYISLVERMINTTLDGVNAIIRGANAASKALGFGDVLSEVQFGGLGRVNFGGAKAAAEAPKWQSDLNAIPEVNFGSVKFSEDSIIAQTNKAKSDRDKKKIKSEQSLVDSMDNLAFSMDQNTDATGKNTKAVLKENLSPMDLADSLLGRIERHLYST